ncbi:MAG: agmatine deiminase family protein [Prevotellaceae bacterium]|jgi:agmatine/peptidylarginine deiminase|nr:agmatine deiminase family protein [Prevotellaceae bacterium]
MRRLPAEWEHQSFVQVTFPHENTDWADMLEEAQNCFCEIINAILEFENVLVVADNKLTIDDLQFTIENTRSQIVNRQSKIVNNKLFIVHCSSNDTWARDHAGITVFENDEKIVLDFTFNGWGLKFPANLDNQITNAIFKNSKNQNGQSQSSIVNYLDCRNFILEGGSIESDGNGTILTTEKCLLSENRNYLTKVEIEEKFEQYFGTKRVLWLKNGYLAGDDTDSHIDTLARFCTENTIAYVKCENENDEHFTELAAMETELKAFRTIDGKPYNLVALPMADEVLFNGERLPATYANFLIINGAVLLPTYNSPKDEIAAQILQKIFPDRKIIKINCLPLIKQHGSLHCATMQFP